MKNGRKNSMQDLGRNYSESYSSKLCKNYLRLSFAACPIIIPWFMKAFIMPKKPRAMPGSCTRPREINPSLVILMLISCRFSLSLDTGAEVTILTSFSTTGQASMMDTARPLLGLVNVRFVVIHVFVSTENFQISFLYPPELSPPETELKS